MAVTYEKIWHSKRALDILIYDSDERLQVTEQCLTVLARFDETSGEFRKRVDHIIEFLSDNGIT